MKSYIILFAIALSTTVSAKAQTTEDSVKGAINKLFDAMKNSDSASLMTAFSDSAVLQTIVRAKNGTVRVMNQKVKEFGSSINKYPKGALDERISFGSIKIDDDLASVWTPYKFYFNNKFLHCGVNSFQLVRIKGEWKIQYLIDTRRTQPCE
jgi:Putative lumazine-binding